MLTIFSKDGSIDVFLDLHEPMLHGRSKWLRGGPCWELEKLLCLWPCQARFWNVGSIAHGCTV